MISLNHFEISLIDVLIKSIQLLKSLIKSLIRITDMSNSISNIGKPITESNNSIFY